MHVTVGHHTALAATTFRKTMRSPYRRSGCRLALLRSTLDEVQGGFL